MCEPLLFIPSCFSASWSHENESADGPLLFLPTGALTERKVSFSEAGRKEEAPPGTKGVWGHTLASSQLCSSLGLAASHSLLL